jgi:hypothetical protein
VAEITDQELKDQILKNMATGTVVREGTQISAPKDQRYVLVLKSSGEIVPYDNPNYEPPRQGPTAAEGADVAQTRAAEELARQRAAETAQRDKNAKDTGYALTDAELARLKSDQASQGLTQQQVDLRAREIEQTGRIAAANNAIAAANNALAAKRLELDEIVRGDANKLDWAKFEYLKAKDAADQEIAKNKLEVDRLQAQQTNQIAQGQLAVQQQTLEQRRAEQAQQAQTAALQASTQAGQSTLQGIGQGAQTGAGMLQARQQAAQGMLGNVLQLAGQGQRSGNMGGGLMTPLPEGFGPGLVSGIQGWATALGGGEDVYNAAANMVRRADPTGRMGADAATAYAVLGQMLDRYQQVSGGQVHPIQQVVAQQQQREQNSGYTAPVTYTPAQQVANRAIASAQTAGATAQQQQLSQPFGGAIAADPMAAAMQRFQAPTVQPTPTTVNINL